MNGVLLSSHTLESPTVYNTTIDLPGPVDQLIPVNHDARDARGFAGMDPYYRFGCNRIHVMSSVVSDLYIDLQVAYGHPKVGDKDSVYIVQYGWSAASPGRWYANVTNVSMVNLHLLLAATIRMNEDQFDLIAQKDLINRWFDAQLHRLNEADDDDESFILTDDEVGEAFR